MSEKRWEIGFLIGPCTDEEAEQFAEDMFDASGGRLGAVMTQSPYTEDAQRPTPIFDVPPICPRCFKSALPGHCCRLGDDE